jgi:hypothetical protein
MNLETIQIHLNSADANCYNNNSQSDCSFYLPCIEIPAQHQILLSVQSAVIPYTFYNIDNTNNILVYNTDSISTHNYIHLAVGNYNAIQLASYLGTVLPNFTITYNIITNKFLFTNSLENFIFYPIVSTAFSILGFNSTTGTLYSTSILKSLKSSQCINLLSKQCVCISSNLQTGNINHSNLSEGNVLCSIPVQSNPYSLITYFNQNNFKTNLYTNTISNINIKITDQNNNLLDLNGCYFSLTLQLEVVNFVE